MFNDAPCLAGGVAGVNGRGCFRLASGLSSGASARGPSWFRVRPIAKSLEFIHYNPAEYLFSSAQATRRAKSMRFSSLGRQAGSQAVRQCRCTGKLWCFSFLPSSTELTFKAWSKLLPAPTLHIKEPLLVVLLVVT